MSMDDKVCVGQMWKRPDGVIVEVLEKKGTDVLLVPVDVPQGKRARRSWKYASHVYCEFSLVGDSVDGH